MSGTAYAPWALSPVNDWTYRMAQKLGWNGEGGDKSCFEVIRRASYDSIIKVQESILTLEDRKRYTLFSFGPVVEPYESTQCFMKQDPKGSSPSMWAKDIPMIVGTCSEEGLLFYKSENELKLYLLIYTIFGINTCICISLNPVTMKKPSTLAKINLAYTLPLHELGIDVGDDVGYEMGKQLKKFYFGFSTVSVETIFVYLMVRFTAIKIPKKFALI